MRIFPEKTIQEVLSAIEPTKLLMLIDYRVDTIQETRDQVKCFCPIHKETCFRTLIIGKRERNYRCSHASCPGNTGGSLIDLFARVREISEIDAVQALVDELSLPVELPAAGEEGNDSLHLISANEPCPSAPTATGPNPAARPGGLRGFFARFWSSSGRH